MKSRTDALISICASKGDAGTVAVMVSGYQIVPPSPSFALS